LRIFGFPLAVGVGLEINLAGVGRDVHGETHAEVVVGHEAREARVFLNQLALAGDDVDAIDVVEMPLAAVVDADQNLARETFADASIWAAIFSIGVRSLISPLSRSMQ
jgi:hypothetical protein